MRVLFGPYYVFAGYAFIGEGTGTGSEHHLFVHHAHQRDNHPERGDLGAPATPHLAAVIGANASWIVAPLLILWRMRREPFPEVAKASSSAA